MTPLTGVRFITSKPETYRLRGNIFLAFLWSILYAIPFHFADLYWSSFFSFVPLFICLGRLRSKRDAFYSGVLAGSLGCALTIPWLRYAHPLGVVLFCLIVGVATGLFAVMSFGTLSELFSQRTPAGPQTLLGVLYVPAAWVLAEYGRSHLPGFEFPWAFFGHSLWKNPSCIQVAEFSGAYGVSYLLVVFNVVLCCVWLCFRAWGTDRKDVNAIGWALSWLSIALLILLSNHGYGWIRTHHALRPMSSAEVVKVALVQGNIAESDEWDREKYDRHLSKLAALSVPAARAKPDVVIWPEASFPDFWELQPRLRQRFLSFVRRTKIPFLVGTRTVERSRGSRGYNSAVLIGEDGHEIKRYRKMRLVPFGEYDPTFGLADRITVLAKVTPTISYTAGWEPGLFAMSGRGRPVEQVVFSVQICYEDIFAEMSRDLVKRGSRLLVNITNDAMFRKTAAPYQHAQASVFRAVENRVPVVRAANSGLSCFIDEYGRILETVRKGNEELFVEGYAVRDVKLHNRHLTFYTKYGDVFVAVCLLYCIFYWIKLKTFTAAIPTNGTART